VIISVSLHDLNKAQTLLVELNEWIQDHVIEDDDELGEYVSMNLFFSDFQAPEK